MTRRWYWETSAQSTVSKNAKTTGITAIIVFVMVLSLFVISIRGSSEFLITGQFHDQNCPAIYENIVVWQDYRNGNWDIYGYNLSTNQEFQITTDLDDQYYPAIYQDFVVWTDSRNGNGDIYGYNLSTKSEFKIATSADHQFYPAIYEDLVVWMETKNNKNNIYAHNLSTRQGFLIYANANAQGTPAIYGNIVVWTDERNGNLDIYGYNLSTKSEFRITSVPSDQRYPAIYGNIVVWTDERNGNWDIYGYNLSTQEEFQITTDPSSQWGPAIYGDFVAWIDFEGIYIYNLSRREGFQITAIVYTISEGIGQIGDPPKIYDETIVWEDHRHGNWDIYGYNLPSTPIISYFTVSIAVQNVYGIPISGASVILGPYPVATTDASGIAVISNVESGTYFLKASAPGYQEKIQPVTITGNQTVDIILHSIPTVTITVRSTSGKAISGATVTMTGPSTYTNTTDAQGKVVFLNVEKDTYTLTVSAVDYQENIQTVTITKTVTIPVVLVSNISVTITAKEISGKAISGATVTMTGPSTYTNTTDAQGKVVFLNVEKDTYTLTVSAVDYQENIQTVTITKTVTIPVVLVTELGHVHGTIYWEGTVPKPAKNVTVRIYDQETNELVEIEITDSQGKFDAEVPKDGIYYIVVEDFTEQRKTGIVPMDSSLTGAFAIMIDSQCYVSGIVVDKFGEGVTGARVTIKDISDQEIADGITDDLGQFNIKVTPGTYYVEITASGYETYKSDIFNMLPKQLHDLGDLCLETRTGILEISLGDEGGAPIDGSVTIKDLNGQLIDTVLAANGIASIILPAGNYSVTVKAKGYSPATISVVVTAGEKTFQTMILGEERGGYSVTAKDEEGNPIQGARILVDGEEAGATDEEGNLLILGIIPGEHNILVRKPGYSLFEENISFVEGEVRSVDVFLSELQFAIGGIVVDKFGEGVTGARVTIKDISDQEIADGITDDLGQFNIKVTPGTYYVEITASGYETYKSDIFTVFSQYSDLGSLALKEPRFRVTDVILVMTIICIISLYILQRSRIAPFIEEHSIPIILVISILMIFTLTRDEEDLRMALISIFGGIIAAIIISLATAKKSQKPRVEDHRFEPYKYER